MPISHLDILIPVMNEADSVAELTRRIHATLHPLKIKYRLIFIDDKSTDSTLLVLRRLQKKYPIIIHKKEGRPGKAASLQEGAKIATSRYVLMIDGDLQYPPEAIPGMLTQIPTHGVVVANRLVHRDSLGRKIFSRTNRYVVGSWLLGLNCDTQSGLKLIRRDIFAYLSAPIPAWAIDIPLLLAARNLGLTIGSVDIDFHPRIHGRSKLSVLSALVQIGGGAVRHRFFPNPPLLIPPVRSSTMIGAGVAFRRRQYITHTTLPLSQSALTTLLPRQKLILVTIIFLVLGGLYFHPLPTGILLISILSLVYFIDVFFNLFIVSRSLTRSPTLSFSSRQLARLSQVSLPTYSILCPLYREAGVLPQFLEAIASLDWPKSRLDVILLLEKDDRETQTAVAGLSLPGYIRVIVVPPSAPKTKPKACNFGLNLARGEYLVVYDAEDRPEPMQLKKAFLAFGQVPPEVVCLQAKLNFYNPTHNLLTRLFTAEYSLWFEVILPGLQSINTTIPLGGTSNHFRTSALRKLAGWDAFNVTEDCDLGARLFLKGFKTAIFDSVTLEEANNHLGNWIRQRSRWIKGYVQTFFVHNRHPLSFIKRRGIHAVIFQLVVGGKIAFMLINPLLWLATFSYFAFYYLVGPTIESLYPPLIFYIATTCAVAGNFLFLYYYMLGCAQRGEWWLIKYVFLVPVYWLMISLAALKGLSQLVFRPHFWEKTHHGLTTPRVLPQIRFAFSLPAWRIPPLPKLPAVSSGVALIIITGLASFLNFLYNLYLGRTISVADFGVITLLGAIFYLSQIPLAALSRTIAHQSASYLGSHPDAAAGFWQLWRTRTLNISLVITLVWLISIPLLSEFFRLSSTLPLVVFSPMWFLGALLAVDSGYLNGRLRFSTLAGLTLIEAVIKFILAVTIIHTAGSSWVYAAFPLSAFAVLIITYLKAKSPSPSSPSSAGVFQIRFPLRFFTTSLLTAASLLSFLCIDVIFAKHYLHPTQAGWYALMALVGKMVYFAGSLFYRSFPAKFPRLSFYRMLGLSSFTSLTAAIVLGVFGWITIPPILGNPNLPFLPYLPSYCLAMAGFAVAGSLINYHQSHKSVLFSAVSVFYAAVLAVVLLVSHHTLGAFTQALLAVSGLHLISILGIHYLSSRMELVNRFRFSVSRFFTPGQAADTSQYRILIYNWRDIRHVWAGGAETYLHELARRWVASGHQVTLFCSNDRKCPHQEVVDGVQIIRRGGFYTVYIWAVWYYLTRFRGNFDVVIDNENGIPFFTPLFCSLPKFLLIHHIHQDYFQRHVRFPMAQIAKFAENTLMPLFYRHHQVITVSPSSKNDILSLGFTSSENIHIITPGVDPSQFTTRTPKTPHPSFLYLGRIRSYKNIDVAIKAFAKVVVGLPAARFYIAGIGESLGQLRQLVQKLNLESSVFFLGRVTETEKVRLLSRSWIMLQPSSFEGWGITVVEANACGTPVIASDVGGLRDSVQDGQTGLLVPVQNVTALAQAMKFLLRQPELRFKLGYQAQVWSAGLNWDILATQFLVRITNLLSPRAELEIVTQPVFTPSSSQP